MSQGAVVLGDDPARGHQPGKPAATDAGSGDVPASACFGLERLEARLLLSSYPQWLSAFPKVAGLGVQLGEDVFWAPDVVADAAEGLALEASAAPAGQRPFGATSGDTSEFMLGSVEVTLVLMESDGAIDAQSENWTAEESSQVISGVNAGLEWWQDTFAAQGLTGELSFSLNTIWADTPFRTSYEPIQRPATDQGLWLDEFFTARGCGSGMSAARRFADNQRLATNCDWACTIFVVDSSADADGMFKDDKFSYAYLGGPFLVMTYDNDGWGIDNMDQAVAHEMGHIFYALDEYPGGDSYTAHSGYYNIQNLNAYKNNPHRDSRVPSVMAEDYLAVQAYFDHTSSPTSLEMIGWRDGDGDGVIDLLDVPLKLTVSGELDIGALTYRVTGHSSVATLSNRNPYPASLNHAITLNQVNRLQYRLDGGPWLDAASYNAYTATIDASIPVPVGASTIEIRTLSLGSLATSDIFSEQLLWVPSVDSLEAAPDPVTRPDDITLTATATDANGSVVSVDFYWESNRKPGLQTGDGGDTPLGTDDNGDDGWSVTFSSLTFNRGDQTFYALATDNDGLASADGRAALFATGAVLNAPPNVGALTGDPNPVVRRDFLELTAADVIDVDGSVRLVQFYRDLDGDGELDRADRSLGRGVLQADTHNYSRRVPTTGWATGANALLVKVIDNEGGTLVAAGSVDVANRPPELRGLVSLPSVVNPGQTLTLRASRPRDLDGSLQKLDFFYDSNDDGQLDDLDLAMGEDLSAGGGWSLQYTLPLDTAAGPTRFFARATDSEGAVSDVVSLVVRVNAAPTLDSLMTTAPLPQGSLLSLTAHDLLDGDGSVARVRFYRDLNADGLLDASDPLLGTGRRQRGTDDYSLSVRTAVWPVGVNALLVQAIDNDGGSAIFSGEGLLT